MKKIFKVVTMVAMFGCIGVTSASAYGYISGFNTTVKVNWFNTDNRNVESYTKTAGNNLYSKTKVNLLVGNKTENLGSNVGRNGKSSVSNMYWDKYSRYTVKSYHYSADQSSVLIR